jgi:hypothetical protein
MLYEIQPGDEVTFVPFGAGGTPVRVSKSFGGRLVTHVGFGQGGQLITVMNEDDLPNDVKEEAGL